jgi:hypothetical protein
MGDQGQVSSEELHQAGEGKDTEDFGLRSSYRFGIETPKALHLPNSRYADRGIAPTPLTVLPDGVSDRLAELAPSKGAWRRRKE